MVLFPCHCRTVHQVLLFSWAQWKSTCCAYASQGGFSPDDTSCSEPISSGPPWVQAVCASWKCGPKLGPWEPVGPVVSTGPASDVMRPSTGSQALPQQGRYDVLSSGAVVSHKQILPADVRLRRMHPRSMPVCLYVQWWCTCLTKISKYRNILLRHDDAAADDI